MVADPRGAAYGSTMLVTHYLPLDSLAPADRNPRTHSPAQIKAIERSLARFGWTTPLGIAEGKLIYGHARRQAALNLRARAKTIPHQADPNLAPTVDLSHLPPEDRRAYLLADNQLAMLAGWDVTLLGAELRELAALNFDLSPIGFSKLELSDLMIEPVGDQRPGSLLELLDITIAEPRHKVTAGDHWILAKRHHLLCCSVIEDWPEWRRFLKKGCLFVPWPGPFIPFGDRAAEFALVMVQPDSYIAGHILDRFADAKGESAVSRAPAKGTPP